MRRSGFVVIGLALACCLATGPPARGASITYELASYPSLQGGIILSGDIVTDGTLGLIGAANILSWDFGFATPQGTAFYRTGGTGDTGNTVNGGVVASPTALTLPQPTELGFESFFSLGSDIGVMTVVIQWQRTVAFQTSPGVDNYFAYPPEGGPIWNDVADSPNTLSLGGDPWVIATNNDAQAVPEPGSVVLMSLGLAAVAVLSWRRRLAA